MKRPGSTADDDRVAVIDIGSNSIKLLVAAPGPESDLAVIEEGIEETRISAGISKEEPVLSDTAMDAVIESIDRLHQTALRTRASRFCATATSAVRDAKNADEFTQRLRARTGLDLRVLTGHEEAELIAAGVRTDPELRDVDGFCLFDLGGGSLEALAIRGGSILSMDSLPLGCVRLTEEYISNPGAPVVDLERRKIENRVRTAFARSAFSLDWPRNLGYKVVLTGGTATVARFLGERTDDDPPYPLSRRQIETHLERISALSLADRRAYPGLPPSRADVFPAALITLLTLYRLGGFQTAFHSFRNLRYGLAARMLECPDTA
jgi:exopolyphosphatase/guanosine-5'-triphosphate,3'-diphosphate pyrophosphatase